MSDAVVDVGTDADISMIFLEFIFLSISMFILVPCCYSLELLKLVCCCCYTCMLLLMLQHLIWSESSQNLSIFYVYMFSA